MSFSPEYITLSSVQNWLQGKVNFGDDSPRQISIDFGNTLCAYAESEVAIALNPFYVIPYTSKVNNGDFTTLPMVTRAYLSNLMVLKSVEKILIEEFGRQSSNIANSYVDNVREEYRVQLNLLYQRDKLTGRYKVFPLPDLLINTLYYTGLTVSPPPMSTRGPFCFKNNMDYAINQITNPAENWWSPNQWLEFNGCPNFS